MDLSRRTALRLLLGAYAALWSAREASAQQNNLSGGRRKVLVIGAGIAGLAAARDLRSKEFDVIVLEARHRLGGRIFTDNSLGFPVDLGASWIHESVGNPIAELASLNSISTMVDDDSWIHFRSGLGKELEKLPESYIRTETSELEKAVWKYAKTLKADVSYAAAVKHVNNGSFAGVNRDVFTKYFLSRLEMGFGAPAEEFSLLYGSNMDSFRGKDLVLPDGYAAIPKTLSAELDIRFGSVVTMIDSSKPLLRVTASGETFEADAVVLSVPLGVLKQKRITFFPELPEYKQQVIDRMGVGLLDKVVLQFSKPFWPVDTAKFGYMSGQRGEFPEFFNWYKFSKQPVLIAYLAGLFAKKLENQSDREVVDEGLAVLRRMFGSKVLAPIGHLVTRWSKDHFAFGSYSHIPVGATDADYAYLGMPVGKIFFAGEATSRRFPATVHGAFMSGVRAAREASESLV
ncbi:MAG: FAD-dependent oxidoreductase [Bdellovibrionales bacterium]|nr:FAD-dependent oxidoreductase [Bdellovibrionales bacterium]